MHEASDFGQIEASCRRRDRGCRQQAQWARYRPAGLQGRRPDVCCTTPLPTHLRGRQERAGGADKEAAKGELTLARQMRAAASGWRPVGSSSDRSRCEVEIEAAPERLDVKHELYGRLAGDRERGLRARQQHLLATDHGSIAAGATDPSASWACTSSTRRRSWLCSRSSPAASRRTRAGARRGNGRSRWART